MPSLYIHIPFCTRKCLYCAFYSISYAPGLADAYLDALRLEAASYRDKFSDRIFETVYLGGGTPTSLSADQLGLIISLIKGHFIVSKDVEFTIEANPGTLTNEKLDVLSASRANRLSIGIQSFSDEVLKRLGRLHSAPQAAAAYELAKKSGFQNIGIDLIYGIPGQSLQEYKDTLSRTIELKPEHLSAYCLSYDEGTEFTRSVKSGTLAPMEDDRVARMYDLAVDAFSRAGYEHYEISNFSLPGHECRHNRNYWDRGEYLGLGPGAWSFIAGRRYANVADVHDYCRRLGAGAPIVEHEEVPDRAQAANEAFMLGLRTNRGADVDRYAETLAPQERQRFSAEITRLGNAGLLSVMNGRLRLTDRGMFVSNEVFAKLAP